MTAHDASNERMARRAGWASFIGTTVEWYDFYLYAAASALVFAPLFFDSAPPAVGVLLSFATFWVGFLARPLGSIFFGHLGDRVGRKKALVSTMLLMGISSVGIGLLPTSAQIGVWAPIMLAVLRMAQGFAVGGEWGGAVLIATEHADPRRGYVFGAFAQQGSPAGRILSTLAFLLVSQLPKEELLAWGWRIPFLASFVLVAVGLMIRLGLAETPAMVELQQERRTARVPFAELIRGHTPAMLLGMGAVLIVFVLVYARDTFALAWATTSLGFTASDFLLIVLLSSVVQFVVQPFGVVLAARWGVRRAVTVLLGLVVPALPAMFLLIGTGNWWLALLGAVLATVPDVMFYAIMAGMFAEAFPANIRYSGISTTYALSGTVGGATPVIMQGLATLTGSIIAPIGFAAAVALLGVFCARAFIHLAARSRVTP
ncbi:MFS transporter [Actinomycetes bacterium KLBMP 9759]